MLFRSLPLAIAFCWLWGASGAAAAVLVSSVVFALTWAVLYARIRKEPAPAGHAPLEPDVVGVTT